MYVTIGIRHAVRIRIVILSIVACLAVLYFYKLSHKKKKIKKKKNFIENKMRVLIFPYNVC
jgi:hypothetical protein